MRKFAAVVGLMLSLNALPGLADEGGPPEWGGAVLKLEDQLKPQATKPAWAQQRKAWRKTIAEYMERPVETKSLLAFEAALQPQALKPDWSPLRAGWIAAIQKGGTTEDTEKAIQQLVEHLQPTAFKPSWAKMEKGWRSDFQKLIQFWSEP